jgi:hypothetical protein
MIAIATLPTNVLVDVPAVRVRLRTSSSSR